MGSSRKVAVVVPAYNEEARISAVLAAISKAELVDETIVVSDGSTDGTYNAACAHQSVTAIRLNENRGKAGAMCAGAAATQADILLFLDADLIGLEGHHVDDLIRPLLLNEADMSVGIFKLGRGPTDLAQVLAPNISGQRALRRSDFLSIPELDKLRSGVEVALTKYFRATQMKVQTVALAGVTHAMKEEKIGLIRGFIARLCMYCEIGKVLTNGHSIGKAARRAREAVKTSDSKL